MSAITKKLSLSVILLCILFLVSFFVFYRIADEAVLEKETGFDEAIIAFRVKHAGPLLVRVMEYITFFGSSLFLLPAYCVLLVYFLLKKQYHFSVLIAFTGLATVALTQALKRLFHRERPTGPLIERLTNYSFPSGHAFSSFIFCSILSYLIWKSKLRPVWKWIIIILLLLLSFAIGVSRIVLNVHFATDVIGGYCLAIMWLILFFVVFRKYL